MNRPVQIFLFIGLGAAIASGCDRNTVDTETAAHDRSNDAVDVESQHRSAMLEPAVQANGPSRGCTANATCPNGAKLTCSVSGNGTCSGVDGVGVQCITYDKDGNPEESGGTCSSS
jgi:hypothetical protein